jgi:peptide-methionine (R)-S-oxide reductase
MRQLIGAGVAAAAVGALGLVMLSFAGAQSRVKPTAKAGEVMGWKIVDGRFADGPYKGFLAESPKRKDKVLWSDEEWRQKLTPGQYKILRNHGTEAAFCGVFHDHKEDGVYKVVAINHPVFKSDAKFDSGTGWPSFFQPYDMDAIWLRMDTSYGMVRMEVLDSVSDGHLGHVFNDGPSTKGGLRFCINSEVLDFVPAKKNESSATE